MIKKYKTKPVEIEAIQFTRKTFEEVKDFAEGNVVNLTIERTPNGKAYCEIVTLEGVMVGTEGDYIIRGLRGEYYPCKPDVFHKKYEEVVE